MFNVPDWQTVPISGDLPNIWIVLELSTPPLLVRTPSKLISKLLMGATLVPGVWITEEGLSDQTG